MSNPKRYAKAPITEAIIDLRWRLREGSTLEEIARVHETEKRAYPGVRKRFVAQGHMEVGPRVAASATQEQIGFGYVSPDQKQIYQARLDGFTFSRLAPYESWEPFRDEARRLWSVYRQALDPARVERIAVRYVNRLDLPGPRAELKDYLRTSPEVADGLPQALDGFFMQLQIPVEEIRSRLLLNETIIEPPNPEWVAVVLDIDLFRTEELPQEEERLWQLFETLRLRKDDFFEACITERTRELFV